jgi:hypothetical protein
MDMRGLRSSAFRWGAWALGLVLLVLLTRRIGTAPIRDALARVGPRLGWLAVTYVVATALNGLPFRLLCPERARPSWGAAIASRFAASGLNALLPLVGAAEVTRLRWLPRSAWPDGVAAIVIDRALFALASALALAVGAVAALFLPRLPPIFVPAAIGVAVLLVAAVVAVLWLAAKAGPVGLLRRSVEKFRTSAARLEAGEGPRRIEEHQADVALRAQLAGPRGPLAAGLALHVAARAVMIAELWLALELLGARVGLGATLVIGAVPIALSALGALVPSQIGLQEGAQAAVTTALGLGAPIGAAMVLLQRARQVLFLPVTALVMFVGPRRAPDTRPATSHHLPTPPTT